MTEAPPFLIETPMSEASQPAIDVLSDMLRVVRLTGSIFLKASFGAPFAVQTEGRKTIASLLSASGGHVTVFHLVAEGCCALDLPEHGRTELQRGDAILLPFGDEHMFSNGDAAPIGAHQLIEKQTIEGVITTLQHGDGPERMTLVCGFVQSGDLFFNPVFRHLPPLLVEHTAAEPVTSHLASSVRHLLTEVEQLRPGSREMLSRTMEMLFIEMLRRYIGRLPADAVGWLGALKDPIVGRVLQLIHSRPLHDWTVEDLAYRCGTSRSVLAERFKAILGQPPMQYVTGWRLQLATAMLHDQDRSIAEIAAAIGYESEAAFSRAFKRHLGLPPGAWRQHHCVV